MKPHYDKIVVITTYGDEGVPHIEYLIRTNPGVPIHIVYGSTSINGESWRNCDRILREWWQQQGQFISFNHLLLIEYDVLFHDEISSVFPDGDFVVRDVKYPKVDTEWIWFTEIESFPEILRQSARGIVPFGAVLFSRRCLAGIMNHPFAEEVFKKDIFCELRIATLCVAAGFEPTENSKKLRFVDISPIQPSIPIYGAFHPVKNAVDW